MTGNLARGNDDEVVARVRVAAAAARAARDTVGVVRLQPGLWGLVRRFSRTVWERVTGEDYPDTGGVEVTLDGARARVEITAVTDGRAQAAAVARAVQDAVARAVPAETGLPVDVVAVHITEIDLYGLPRRARPAG